VTPLPADPGFARFDFAIELQEEAGGGLGGYVEYDTALCTAQTAAELARDYERLVDALLREPDTRLRDVADALGLGSAASITRHTKEHHHAA
jgi:hypothetical protein